MRFFFAYRSGSSHKNNINRYYAEKLLSIKISTFIKCEKFILQKVASNSL